MKRIECPNCHESNYIENYSTCTAMYFPPQYKDGVNVNPDGNTTTTYCSCCSCNHNFSYETQYGEVQRITDRGPRKIVPVVKTPINEFSSNASTTVAVEIKSNDVQDDFKILQKIVKELCMEVENLKKDVWLLKNPGAWHEF